MVSLSWIGSNKNEFVVAIGLDDQNNVQWAHPFSWTKKERLKIDARHFVEGQDTLDLQVLVDFLYHELKDRFDRREFSEFDYLSVKPPIWAVILVFVLSVLANVGIGWFVVANEYKS